MGGDGAVKTLSDEDGVGVFGGDCGGGCGSGR